ncbi:MAG: MFS transporter [Treponema sp.]|nr:MFS transporter [Candidatus Treponema merdequi]
MEKLDSRTKWCYTAGATGRDAAWTLISMYLMSYIQYTMKLTAAQFAVIGAIMILCLVWDAINDPMMGIIIENCHFKSGKYKPWIFTGAILNAIVIILLFTLRPTGWGFVAFFGVGYLLWGMTYTMNDIAYWGMLPSLSSDPKERNTLVTMMHIFISIGQFSVAGIVPVIIAGNAVSAYRIVALCAGLGLIAFQMLTTFGVKERHHAAEDNVEKLSLKQMFQIFARNDQLVAAGIACVLFYIGQNQIFMFGMNFFYFEFGYSQTGSLLFIFTVIYGVSTLLAQVAFPFVSKLAKRQKLIKVLAVILFTAYILFLSIGYVLPKIPVLVFILGAIIFFCQSLFALIMIVMINNTVEYDEYKFHERHDSVISTVRSFSVKLASAVNQGIINLVLILSGLFAISQKVSNLEAAKAVGELTSDQVLSQADSFLQSTAPSQLLILRLGIVLVPVIAITIAAVILNTKYKITEEMYDDIRKKLD